MLHSAASSSEVVDDGVNAILPENAKGVGADWVAESYDADGKAAAGAQTPAIPRVTMEALVPDRRDRGCRAAAKFSWVYWQWPFSEP